MEQATKTRHVHMDVFPDKAQVRAWNALSRVQQVEQLSAEIKQAHESRHREVTRGEIIDAGKKVLAKLKAQNQC